MKIAERNLVVAFGGQRKNYRLTISTTSGAAVIHKGDVCFEVVEQIDGEERKSYPVFGVDSLQAFALSADLARTLVKRLVKNHPNVTADGQIDSL